MPVVIGLIYALGVFLFGAGEFLHGLAAIGDLEVVRKYFSQQAQTAQVQPSLNEDVELLYVEFGRQMDQQYQLTLLKREILKLPALPEEGH